MSKYETAASKAEAEILKMMPAEDHVYRQWQLAGYSLQARTLKTTSDEVRLLLDQEAYLRPGYQVKDGKAYIPNLFVKLAGPEDYRFLCPEPNNEKSKLFLFYDSIQDFGNITGSYLTEKEILGVLNEYGLLDKQKLFDSRIYRYGYLRKEYQEILIDKINYIITYKKQLFLASVGNIGILEILFTLLNIDEKLVALFNNFDFQYDLPRVVIKNENRSGFTAGKACLLVLLNLLGFDLIIYSNSSYADVENVLNKEMFDVFYINSPEAMGKNHTNSKGTVFQFIHKHRLLFAASILAVIIFVGITAKTLYPVPDSGTTETGSSPSGHGSIEIVSFSPQNLKGGVISTADIVVQYEYLSKEKGGIVICVNDNSGDGDIWQSNQNDGPESRFIIKSNTAASEGSYRITLKAKIAPVKWDNANLALRAILYKEDKAGNKTVIFEDSRVLKVD